MKCKYYKMCSYRIYRCNACMKDCPDHCYHFEPDRPHGEWIKTGRTNVYGGFEVECSQCHTKLMVSPSRWEIGENFCDVCGAKMKEGDENESDHL